MIYLVDWLDLIKKAIKRELRQASHLDLLMGLNKPLQTLNENFNDLTVATNYKLSFTGQTIYLEHYLNDVYDDAARRIYIENTATQNYAYIYKVIEAQTPLYIYKKSEGKPPLYLYSTTEPLTSVHFIVWVPVDITFDETVMRAQIDQYRIMGKIYLIQTF